MIANVDNEKSNISYKQGGLLIPKMSKAGGDGSKGKQFYAPWQNEQITLLNPKLLVNVAPSTDLTCFTKL